MSLVIRPAQPADAAAMINHVQRLAEEPGICLPLGPGEFTVTVEQEVKMLRDINASDNSVFMVALEGDTLVGIANVSGGKRKAVRHVGSIGVSVHKDYRGKGVGWKLMTSLIRWARETDVIKRLELLVFKRNEPAIKLYQNLGFKLEGKKEKVVFKDGVYEDELIMGLLLA